MGILLGAQQYLLEPVILGAVVIACNKGAGFGVEYIITLTGYSQG
jgi:hypothetical protein